MQRSKNFFRIILSTLFQLGLLQFVCKDVAAQPDAPSSVTTMAIGARIMHIQWTHSGNFGLSNLPQGFIITIRSDLGGTTTVPIADDNARIHILTGVTPFQYSSSSGVQFSVGVQANSNNGPSSSTSTEVILPPCPGTCDYRYYTIDPSFCSSPSRCVCNTAYSGTNCNTPNFAPGNIEAVFNRQVDADTPELTVKWDPPQSVTLDGRVLSNYIVNVSTLQPGGTTSQIVTGTFAPNLDPTRRNVQVLRELVFSTTFRDFNYAVTVETVTDVAGDVAVSQAFNVATHIPGPPVNVMATAATTSISVSWEPPVDANDLITQYHVTSTNGITIVVPPTVLSATINDLVPTITYAISVFAENGVGIGTSVPITVTTESNMCLANFYGLPTGTVCTPCPENTVSSVGSQNITDCACIPGYVLEENICTIVMCPPLSHPLNGRVVFTDRTPGSIASYTCEPGYAGATASTCQADGTWSTEPECNECALGTYSEGGNASSCTSCPEFLSTTSRGSTHLANCSLCRYSEGSYPQDTCYYFSTTLSLNITNVPSAGVSFVVTWPQEQVDITDKRNQRTEVVPINGLQLNCVSTGRGLVSDGYFYNRTVTFESLTLSYTVSDSDLLGLVEYSCTSIIRAFIEGANRQGPTSPGVAIVTRPLENTLSTALPSIVFAIPTSSTSLRVRIGSKINFTELLSNTTLVYSFPRISADETHVSLLNQTQGFLFIDGLVADQLITLLLRTVILEEAYDSSPITIFLLGGGTDSTPPTTPIISTFSPPDGAFVHHLATFRTSFQINWSEIQGASGYNVYISLDTPGASEWKIMVIGGSVTHQLVEELQPFTAYTYQLTTVNADGFEGMRSEIGHITTISAPSGPPADVIVTEVAGNLINVTWGAPDMPNGEISGYRVTIMTPNGVTVDSYDRTTFFTLLSKPDSAYTVTVQALSLDGAGEAVNATPSAVITLPPLTSPPPLSTTSLPLFSLIIPVAAGGGGGLICLVMIAMVCCCCCCCSRKKKRGHADIQLLNSNSYTKESYADASKREPALLPMQENIHSRSSLSQQTLTTFVNPNATEDYLSPTITAQDMKSDLAAPQDYVAVESGLAAPQDYVAMESGLAEPEEQYAEISTNGMRRHTTEPALVPFPVLPLSSPVKKEATPEDYGNEELYMEMQKIYFTDPEQANSLTVYEFDRSQLDFINEIGHGEFGRVMKATATGIIPGQATSIVAVKMLKDGADDKTRKNFLSEAQLLATFGSHPNVMGLLRVVCQSTPRLVIIPYMPNGDLKHYLRKCEQDKNSKLSVGTSEKLHISEQIAAGMEYLAGKFFIHRDLAARNVLVGENHIVKINDFGLSRALAKDDSYYKLSQTLKLPVKWMALESLLYQKFSTYSDVWSFGIVLWEIFSYGATPYKGIKSMNISHHVQKGNRLSRPEECPQALYQMMQDCWKAVKEERPTFTQLKLQLKAQAIVLRRQSKNVPVGTPTSNELEDGGDCISSEPIYNN